MKNYSRRAFQRRVRQVLFALLVSAIAAAGCGRQSADSKFAPAQSRNSAPTASSPIQTAQVETTVAEAPSPDDQTGGQPPTAAPNSYLSSLAKSISQAYNSAKSQGQTAAGNARDWLLDDLNSNNRWEYKVIVAAESDTTKLEIELNELGRQGWQCFHVQPDGTALRLFFQRHPSSLSSNIPMSDLLKALPYLGLNQGDR